VTRLSFPLSLRERVGVRGGNNPFALSLSKGAQMFALRAEFLPLSPLWERVRERGNGLVSAAPTLQQLLAVAPPCAWVTFLCGGQRKVTKRKVAPVAAPRAFKKITVLHRDVRMSRAHGCAGATASRQRRARDQLAGGLTTPLGLDRVSRKPPALAPMLGWLYGGLTSKARRRCARRLERTLNFSFENQSGLITHSRYSELRNTILHIPFPLPGGRQGWGLAPPNCRAQQ
jgi:hypothetical protein